ncbi:hypothetical protein HK407_07g11580, partial [Ordospora pajunii]|uniref:uncharacterized protein n=1 Tax=Ordospora pajunii TaxID=3039483 RepID=UPI00295290C5
GMISTNHGDEYLANILLSIDDNRLRSMIFDLKDRPILILKMLNGADDIGKLSRLFNIIKSSGISEQNMQIVLDEIVINAKIVNKMIDKPENERNAILRGIDNTQLVNKIKCAVKEAEKLRKVGIATIAVAVVVIEALFTRMSIKDALNNGHAMSDEAVISRIAMAAVAMLMMLSVIVYVKCANRPVWYDRLMIGGSLVMALVRVFMGVFGGMRVKMMVVMSLVMVIASIIAIINSRINNGNNESRIAKNVIVVLSTLVMVITGWVTQNVHVTNVVNN